MKFIVLSRNGEIMEREILLDAKYVAWNPEPWRPARGERVIRPLPDCVRWLVIYVEGGASQEAIDVAFARALETKTGLFDASGRIE